MKTTKGIVKEIPLDKITEAANFTWAVYQDKSKRTTPPYGNLEEILSQFRIKVKSKKERLLGYYEDEKLEGVFSIDIGDKDRYIGTTGGPYIAKSDAYNEIANAFMAYVFAHCKGYSCYFNTTKTNINSQNFIKAMDFECIDDCVQTRIEPKDLLPVEKKYEVELLKEADYDMYKAFHTKYFSGYTWTAEKIYEVMDKWQVHVVKIEGEIVGNIFSRMMTPTSAEVYGAMVLPEYEKSSMISQLYYENTEMWIKKGFTEIINFIPEGYLLEASKQVGYIAFDTYMCFHKKEL